MTPDRELLLAVAATMLHHPNFRHHLSEDEQQQILHSSGLTDGDHIVHVLYQRFIRAASQNE